MERRKRAGPHADKSRKRKEKDRAKLELAYQAADCAASGGTATGVLPMPQWAETTQQVRRRTAEPDPEPSPCPRHRANQWR